MVSFRCAYAGIGTRDLTIGEAIEIGKVAKMLSKMDILLYSGSAPGSDVCFMSNSNGKNVAFIPWDGFEKDVFDYTKESVKYYVMGDSQAGLDSIKLFHPNPQSLSSGAKKLMARNYHQIHGMPPLLPMVSFVVCCATPKGDSCEGGTSQAVRIANSLKIPVVNIRKDNWKAHLKSVVTETIKNLT